MSNFHLGVSIINRRKNSVTRRISYVCGKKLYDKYRQKFFYSNRMDVVYHNIFLPSEAPSDFRDLQTLCNELEQSERRYDACIARAFIGSLPNELSMAELIQITRDFVQTNFVEQGLCAVVAIHKGLNKEDPSKNNPHTHIIVSTRTVDSDGFSKYKYREHNQRKYIHIWRKSWENVQNRAYERKGLDVRVDHRSLASREIEREPMVHLTLMDWYKEQRGTRTIAGDKNRAIKKRNSEREHQKTLERDFDRFR